MSTEVLSNSCTTTTPLTPPSAVEAGGGGPANAGNGCINSSSSSKEDQAAAENAIELRLHQAPATTVSTRSNAEDPGGGGGGGDAPDKPLMSTGGQKSQDVEISAAGVAAAASSSSGAATGTSKKGTSFLSRSRRLLSSLCSSSSSSSCCNSFRKFWSRLTPLERWLLAGLTGALLLVLVFLVLVISMSSSGRWWWTSAEDVDNRNGGYIQDINGATICLTPQCVQTSSYLLAAMDPTADPCDDFFQFACGAWNRKHIIPEDRSSISTFEVLADQLQIILKSILEEDRDAQDNDATLMAKYFYQSCMDMARIEEVSDRPLRDVIVNLGGWPVIDPEWSEETTLKLETVLGLIKRNFTIGVLIEEWVGPDDKNSKSHIIQIDQMPLGLPSRDYFLHSESEKDLEAYHLYMTDVAVLLGANRSDAYEQLWTVVEFEQLLANITVPEEDRIDTGAIYTKLPLFGLKQEVPQLDWNAYFDTVLAGVPYNESEGIVSYSMPYFRELGRVLEGTDRKVVHNYVIWRLVMDLMPHMPPQYEQTRAEFRRVLLGVLTDRNRWNRCVEWTNKKLGMAVGALFIRDNFNHESKATALEMIHEIREAFNDLLEENEWMDEETRMVAKDKANSMNERIGYPEYITNATRLEEEYENLEIDRGRFLENLFNILRFEAEKNVNKLRKPVDKNKWATEPAVVNAFYNPNKNDIVFPAGILQPLFYSQHFPKSLNYGGIGVVIGHEITHGFDDKGRQFDKEGNLKQWWNNRTIAEFRAAASCIVDQYSQYKLEEINLPINGRMTQGENIADNGGLKQAFRAYSKWVKEHGEEALLPGLNMTHEQLFFLNYAQIWCGSMRPEDALTKIRSSVHSPGPIRVLGPLSNSWDFARAYRCPIGSKMNQVKKCSVW